MILNLKIKFNDENDNKYEYRFGTNYRKNGRFIELKNLNEEQILKAKNQITLLLEELFK